MYQVNGDIAIADSVELYGTQSGIAVTKARDAYAIKTHNYHKRFYARFTCLWVAISFAHTVNVTLDNNLVWSQIKSGYALVVPPS